MNMNVLIVDDDQSVTKSIEFYIDEWAEINHHEVNYLSHTCLRDIDVLSVIHFDLVILDIIIGKDNGIEFARKLRESGSDSTIAFISNYSSFAIEGYTTHAISYVLKPIDRTRIFSVLDETEKRIGDYNSKTICFTYRSGHRIISTRSILYISSIGKHVDVKLTNKVERFIMPMKDIELQLYGSSLVRCHKSFIVNTNYISRISSNTIELEGSSDIIPIGRAYSENLKKKLFDIEGGDLL